MNEYRSGPAAAWFEDTDFWWITGGSGLTGWLNTSEVLNKSNGQFVNYVDIPIDTQSHSLVNINSTHMVMVGGVLKSDQAYIFDRYFY